MSARTEQPTETAIQPQGSHHWVVTLEIPGRLTSTQSSTFTPPQGWTRRDAFAAIRDELARDNPDLARANVTFFALEPNQL
ncbi:hypothetical protein OG302_29485 [Streptomyces sp. NBC_01283]|uniref:hypothetical protein n=1 Tax=Streptomyces sp. NBC_01283 TaxID=2903812 RepID=UPI00352EE45A|nr:hypothetical protein OG302_29485 [Streptomyces sp. NBC_01283]